MSIPNGGEEKPLTLPELAALAEEAPAVGFHGKRPGESS